MSPELEHVWSAVLDRLTDPDLASDDNPALSRQQQAWLRLVQPIAVVNGFAMLAAPSAFARDNRNVMRIQNAIHEVMGMKFSDYIGKSRKRDGFYARMIFVHHCRALKMKLTKIAQYVHRDHSSMLHILKKYGDDMRFNPQFRDIATKVNDILNRNNEKG